MEGGVGRIDRRWDTRAEIRERTRRLAPDSKRRAASTNELLIEILGRDRGLE